MKILRVTAAAILAVSLIFGTAACRERPKNPDDGGETQLDYTTDPARNPIDPSLKESDYPGLHDYTCTERADMLIENGGSAYKIVVPAEAGQLVGLAGSELVTFLRQSTGVTLPVVTDAGLTYAEGDRIVSVGDTALAESAGAALTRPVGVSGFEIKTIGNAVFLLGGGDFGTLNAAYEFLYRTVGFKAYSNDAYYTDVKTAVPMYDFAIADAPDFTYRVSNYGKERNDVMLCRRLRINTEEDVWMPVGTNYWHNTFDYLPPDDHKKTHPKWYSSDGKQLCFNAHGDEKEAAALFDAFFDKFVSVVEEYPDRENITITQQDINVWCQCPACEAERAEYGTNAATIVKFCNRISDAYAAYQAENQTDRKINICFFAYHKTENAPVVKDENGMYKAIDDSVVCRDNVCVFYAPIFADYSHSFYEAENKTYAETMTAWKACSDKLYLWIYSTNFSHYMFPFNSFNSMQNNYRFALSRGGTYMFDQGQWNNAASTGWGTLKMWLNSKLQWNSSLDMNDLLDEFFAAYYGPAEKEMRALFDLYRAHMAYLEYDLNCDGNIYNDNGTSEYWPMGTVESLLGLLDEAYKALEPLKDESPDLYATLYDRVCLESIAYRYMSISLYGSKKDADAQIADKKAFKDDCTRLNITRQSEGAEITGLWTTWGLL